MPETHPTPEPPHDEKFLYTEEQIERRQKVYNTMVEKLKPWLFEFGSWIFGGLIAFNLVIVAPLLTMNPTHPAIPLSIAAFACALPLNASGIFLLKLIKDMSSVSIDDMMKKAFEEADVPRIEDSFPPSEDKELLYKRRTDVGLRYTVRLGFLSAILTLFGMIAVLYYIGWWVALLFVVMVIISIAMTFIAMTRLMRPESDAERRQNTQYREQYFQNVAQLKKIEQQKHGRP